MPTLKPIAANGIAQAVIAGVILAALGYIWNSFAPSSWPSVATMLTYTAAVVLGAALVFVVRAASQTQIGRTKTQLPPVGPEENGSQPGAATSPPPEPDRLVCTTVVAGLPLPARVLQAAVNPEEKNFRPPARPPVENNKFYGEQISVLRVSFLSTFTRAFLDCALVVRSSKEHNKSFTVFGYIDTPNASGMSVGVKLLDEAERGPEVELPVGDVIPGKGFSVRLLIGRSSPVSLEVLWILKNDSGELASGYVNEMEVKSGN